MSLWTGWDSRCCRRLFSMLRRSSEPALAVPLTATLLSALLLVPWSAGSCAAAIRCCCELAPPTELEVAKRDRFQQQARKKTEPARMERLSFVDEKK